MIVVLGRPALAALPSETTIVEGGEQPANEVGAADAVGLLRDFLAGPIAIAAAANRAQVELVGSIGDDPEGDELVVELGRAGVGHAALLRDAAGRTPISRVTSLDGRPLPRLDGEDIRLGLGYLMDYRVLVLADPLDRDAEAVALEAALYHGAAIVAVVPPDLPVSDALGAAATILEAPAEPGSRFAELVGRFAALLDGGSEAGRAFAEAVRASGWERSTV